MALALPDDLTPQISAMMILDSDGKRIASKYKESKKLATIKSQLTFEKKLYEKASKTSARHEPQILVFGGYTVVYKTCSDTTFLVLGGTDENEMLLLTVLNTMLDSIEGLLSESVSKRSLLLKFDVVLLALDEIMDDGLIVDTNVQRIIKRVSMKETDAGTKEETLATAIQKAKEHFVRSFAS